MVVGDKLVEQLVRQSHWMLLMK